jgi:hypothetical protein
MTNEGLKFRFSYGTSESRRFLPGLPRELQWPGNDQFDNRLTRECAHGSKRSLSGSETRHCRHMEGRDSDRGAKWVTTICSSMSDAPFISIHSEAARSVLTFRHMCVYRRAKKSGASSAGTSLGKRPIHQGCRSSRVAASLYASSHQPAVEPSHRPRSRASPIR